MSEQRDDRRAGWEDGKESTFSSLPPVTRISVVKVTD